MVISHQEQEIRALKVDLALIESMLIDPNFESHSQIDAWEHEVPENKALWNLLWRGCDLRLNELKMRHLLSDIETISKDNEYLRTEWDWLMIDIEWQANENSEIAG